MTGCSSASLQRRAVPVATLRGTARPWSVVGSKALLLLGGRRAGRNQGSLAASGRDRGSVSLADLMTFESALDTKTQPTPQPTSGSQEDPTLRAQEILARASRALAAAREVIAEPEQGQQGQASSSGSSEDPTRAVLRSSLESGYAPQTSTRNSSSSSSTAADARPSNGSSSSGTASGTRPSNGSSSSGGGNGSGDGSGSERGAMPAWADSLFGGRGSGGSGSFGSGSFDERERQSPLPPMQRQQQQQQQQQQQASFMFAEPEFLPTAFLDLQSQDQLDMLAARSVTLPPLQSVLDLTSASQPPKRQGEMEVEGEQASVSAPTAAGQMLADGKGVLADGTRWEKRSGEEFGPDGYWKRWTLLSGSSADGAVAWEECWWEASDYKGFRELGAAKKGNREDGAAWNEAWNEKMYHDQQTGDKTVERTAHKWARAGPSDEWEEQWGEKYNQSGPASKWANKWARQSENVWHERWGEDYDGGGGCVKYTDKWAEHLVEGAAPEQWGDKWTESFKDGKGSKNGEVWTASSDGNRYNRWWNEDHYGNGYVRKHGNSTGGEYWDSTEQMDTYYNPIPHFGFELAVKHSPDLVNIPLLRPGHAKKQQQKKEANGNGGTPGGGAPPQEPPDDGGLGGGLDAF